MKKGRIYLSLLGLALLMFIGIDLDEASATTAQSHQLTNASERENEVANTRYVEVERLFGVGENIPSTYYYSSAGWRGTLELYSMRNSAGNGFVIATYVGNVHCSGSCPIGE